MATDAPPLDVERLVALLDRHRVEYLLVGGVAAIAHGATRPTVDFDCLARRTQENLARHRGRVALPQLRRSLDVGQQERHHAAGELPVARHALDDMSGLCSMAVCLRQDRG
jgi:hypothetical protein